MDTLQESFDKLIEESFKLEILGPRFVRKRLNDLGINLSKKQIKRINDQFRNLDKDGLHFEFEDNQVIKAGFKSEKEFRAALNSLPDDFANDLERFATEYLDSLPEMLKGISDEASVLLLKNIKRKSKRRLKARRKDFSRFESRLRKAWQKAFDLLEMLIAIALQAGEDYNSEFRKMASEEKDLVFEVLTRLHARACQMASEILTLLRSGYADGAHARWRSLHEITVTGLLIGKNDNELSERYLLYDGIESYKATKVYQQHCKYLGYEPLTEEELTEMTKEYNYLVDRYGKSYKNEYGWASTVIGKDRPTFKDIEETVGLNHLQPYYKMACHNVHANPRGLFFKLGLLPETGDILLAGPSNVGLTDPGHSSALSLCQITVSLLTHDPNLDRLVQCHILMNLEREIGDAFWEAERKLTESV